jgi:hypothetical protein
LEFRKAINEVDLDISKLKKLLDYANSLRQSVTEVTGQSVSGMMGRWKKEFEEDKNIFNLQFPVACYAVTL